MQTEADLYDTEHGNIPHERHNCARDEHTRRHNGEEHDVLYLILTEDLVFVVGIFLDGAYRLRLFFLSCGILYFFRIFDQCLRSMYS